MGSSPGLHDDRWTTDHINHDTLNNEWHYTTFFRVTTSGVNGYQPEVGQGFVSLSVEDFEH